jgi:type II secretory pathway pseudopilin PulG
MTRKTSRELPLSDFVIPLRFDVLLPRRRSATKTGILSLGNRAAFTIIELLVVIAIIITLAGLILSTVGYVQKKGSRSRAETEIAAISAALESYRADNGIYPTSAATNLLKANSDGDPTQNVYANASVSLYQEVSGDHDNNRVVNASDDLSGNGVVPRSYMAFRPNTLLPAPPSTANVTGLRDPFGNSYGYSTVKSSNPAGTDGYNPTFDLWSTAGTTTGSATERAQWIKNW